jgi:DNA-binding Lrp family transcriptional regulator
LCSIGFHFFPVRAILLQLPAPLGNRAVRDDPNGRPPGPPDAQIITGCSMSGGKLDPIDRKILAELQADGRMTNVELSRRVGISAPPCLRRVRTLEEAGLIRGYHAKVDARALGFEVMVFAMVGLQKQAEADLIAFEDQCRAWPLVRECHMLNGEIDFLLKCVAPDLSTFQSFLTGKLTSAPNVASVKTSLVIRPAKDEPGVPFDVMEARAAAEA